MLTLPTFQDFEEAKSAGKLSQFMLSAISIHKSTAQYCIAVDADEYFAQRNVSILKYQKTIRTLAGEEVVDIMSANHKITSNFFFRFVTQENQYLLGNGVSFSEDGVKEKLGNKFDTELQRAGNYALIHGVSFGFWNFDRLKVFKLTEFVPLWDEENGNLRAGIRFWQINPDKPLRITLYEEDGITEYKSTDVNSECVEITPKHAYKSTTRATIADGVEDVVWENYPSFPIVPLWGNPNKQSELVGMRQGIDSYDLIKSGFANDLTDCALIYWIIENADGMEDIDKLKFLDTLKTKHLATVDSDTSKITPYTQDIPYESRIQYLDRIRSDLYEDFGALDVSKLSSGSKTATEIESAYQPLDNKCDMYEYQVIDFVQRILELQGITNVTPTFKRSRVINESETTTMILAASTYLDDETIIKHLPFISPDEVKNIIKAREQQEAARISIQDSQINGIEEEEDDDDNPIGFSAR